MTNDELESKLSQLVRDERCTTDQIIDLIAIANERKLYLERGYQQSSIACAGGTIRTGRKDFGPRHRPAWRKSHSALFK